MRACKCNLGTNFVIGAQKKEISLGHEMCIRERVAEQICGGEQKKEFFGIKVEKKRTGSDQFKICESYFWLYLIEDLGECKNVKKF